MKSRAEGKGARAFVLVVVAVVVAAAVGAAFFVHGMVTERPAAVVTSSAPTPTVTEEEHVQPTPETLPTPTYPVTSSCGRKGESNGLDAENVLGFEGLCIPLTVLPADYGQWDSGEPGDWVDGKRGKVNYCDPARGCTSIVVYAQGEEYLNRADCGEPPKHRNNMLVDGYTAVHAYIRKCGANLDQFQHVWVVETPQGSIAVVAESPATMSPGEEDGSSTPARVGEAMAVAKVFAY